eukprot:7507968-Alexandrium_andersonii.AAC.1
MLLHQQLFRATVREPCGQQEVVGKGTPRDMRALGFQQAQPRHNHKPHKGHAPGAPLWQRHLSLVGQTHSTAEDVPEGGGLHERNVSGKQTLWEPGAGQKKVNNWPVELVEALVEVQGGGCKAAPLASGGLHTKAGLVPGVFGPDARDPGLEPRMLPTANPRLSVAEPQLGPRPIDAGQDGDASEAQRVKGREPLLRHVRARNLRKLRGPARSGLDAVQHVGQGAERRHRSIGELPWSPVVETGSRVFVPPERSAQLLGVNVIDL